jgi:alpha-D-ribose 1-methylphosphonate 5-triphosphate synthase subunit PhnG
LQAPQRDGLRATIKAHVIEPLAAAQAARLELKVRKAAATKVDFYTLAREAATPPTAA